MQPTTYLISLCVWLVCACSSGTKQGDTAPTTQPPVVGADTDEHGCKGSAGYQWSAVQQKCVQLAAEAIRLDPAGADKGLVAYLLFASFDNDAQAEVFLPGQPGRVLPKAPGEGAGSWTLDTLTLSQWKGMYSLSGTKGLVLYEGHANTDEKLGNTGLSGQEVPTMLTGTWQRVDNPAERFTIAGKTLTHYAEGKKGPAQTFAYVPDCGGTACAGQQSPYGCVTTAGQFDIDCQRVEVITNTELALSQGAEGAVVHYRKMVN